MVDPVPWFALSSQGRSTESNEGMVDELVRGRSLSNEDCIRAFKAVDRGSFWPSEGRRFAYTDTPLRAGRLHISAPHIYARALESLWPLAKGMSFLNVGSGTGYFNSIVSELIGPLATNHGVEVHPETVDHARARCRELGKENIEFTVGNIYQLDVNRTSKYDRIYLGACANSKSKYLYRLLEVGGVLIGPFQQGIHQQLRRVTRVSETEFRVEDLGSVTFATLLEPEAAPTTPPVAATEVAEPRRVRLVQDEREGSSSFRFSPPRRRGFGGVTRPGPAPEQLADDCGPLGLPGVPFAFSLLERVWSPARNHLYPPPFRRVVQLVTRCRRSQDATAPFLPLELWTEHILPLCGRHWFDAPAAAPEQEPAAAEAEAEGEEFESPFKKARDSDSDCEGGRGRCDSDVASTRAPSSRRTSAAGTPLSLPGSAQSTPFSGPSASPDLGPLDEEEVDLGPLPEHPEELGRFATWAPAQPARPLVEVFHDGTRHRIGHDEDPDDAVAEERFTVPLEVFHWFMQRAERRQRRRREAARRAPAAQRGGAGDSGEEDDDEDDEEEEVDYDDGEGEDEPMEQALDEGEAEGLLQAMDVESEAGHEEAVDAAGALAAV